MRDFRLWLSFNVDGNEPGEVRSLYDAVLEGEPTDDGPWEITRQGEKMFIRLGDGDWLELLSENARHTFLSIMDEMFGHGMGVETWSDCERAIDNDKS